MITKVRERFRNYQFSDAFFYWIATLAFLPLAIYLRFVIGTYLILDKNFPDYSRMVIILGFIMFIWLIWKWLKDRHLMVTGLEPYLGLFLFLVCLSTVFSVNAGLSLEKLIGIFAYVICFYFLLDTRRNKYLWQGIINGLLITAVVSSLVILISLIPFIKSYQIGIIDLISDPIYSYKVFPRLPNSNSLHHSVTAGYLVLILPLAIYQFFQTRNLAGRIIQSFAIAINLAVLLLTKSRGGFLGLALMMITAIIIFRKKIYQFLSKNKILIPVVITIVGSIGIGIYLLLESSRGFSFAGRNIQLRFQLWQTAAMIIKEHPWLGSGLGTFAQEYNIYRDPSYWAKTVIHSHNQIVQITLELGLLSLISLLAISWKYYLLIVKNSTQKLSSKHQFSLIALVGLFGVLIPDAIFTSSTIVVLMFFYLIWMIPVEDLNQKTIKPIALFVITALFIFVGLGAGWNSWKVKPYYEAILLGNKGNWTEAISKLEFALERDPQNPYYKYMLGFTTGQRACLLGDDFSAPIAYYLSSLDVYPNYDVSHANLAGLYSGIGDYAQAAEHMEYAIQSYSRQPFYKCLLGDYYWELNRMDDALTSYALCIKESPMILDSSYWKDGKNKISYQYQIVSKAKALPCETDSDVILKSELLFYSGNAQEALELVKAFMAENPSDLEASKKYFHYLSEMDRLFEAETQLQERIGENPEDYVLWFYLGKLAHESGDTSKAQQAFEIMWLRRSNIYSITTMGNIYLDKGDIVTGEEYLWRAFESGTYPMSNFSRHVASRWPMRGIYNSCLPEIRTYNDYIDPILHSTERIQNDNCFLAACMLNKLTETNPPLIEAQIKLLELPCYESFDANKCKSRVD